jgi:chitinase
MGGLLWADKWGLSMKKDSFNARASFILFVMILVSFASPALADVGGTGASCNPSTAGWPGCTKATVLIKQAGQITNTVHIAGGNYATPYIASTPNTEYILDGDITADSTAITVTANYVVINLNGHTITYNQVSPGEGVNIGTWNRNNIAVVNGSVIQGAALSEGDQYGRGNNPVSGFSNGTMYGADYLQVANLYVRYGGRDVGGVIGAGDNGLFEENTIEDTYEFGTLKNRHVGVPALTGTRNVIKRFNIYRNNTIKNSRHRGIDVGDDSETYGNHITTRAIATNANGIGTGTRNILVHHNTVIARGEHSIGIAFGGTSTPLLLSNIEIHSNYIDAKTTALGEEYGGTGNPDPAVVYGGNNAAGFRTTWGGNGINFHDNTIIVISDSDYLGTYSPTGAAARINTPARGLMVMLMEGETAIFQNNTITALDKDGTGDAKGIAVTGYGYEYGGNNSGMVFRGNTVTSNLLNVALGDAYGAGPGWPLFIQNTFVKSGNHANYATIGSGLGGYYVGTGKFVSNTYQGGAAETSLKMNFGNHPTATNAWKSIMFGRLMTATVKNSSDVPQSGISLTTHSQLGDSRSVTYDVGTGKPYLNGVQTFTTPTNSQLPVAGNTANTLVTTDANGQAQFIVYDYELNDIGTPHNSPTVNTVYYRPHTIELAGMFTTVADNAVTAWDYLTSSGTFTLTGAGGSITINTQVGGGSGSAPDISAPVVNITSPSNSSFVSANAQLSVNTSDNVGVIKVEYYINNVLQSTSTVSPFGSTWNTTLLSNGTYAIKAKAYDAAGNVATSSTVSVTVNNPVPDATAPVTSLSSPANSTTVNGSVLVAATANDSVGVTRVDFYINGSLRASVNTLPYNFTWNTAAETNGAYTLSSKAYDAAGNVGTSSAVSVTVNNVVTDVTAPVMSSFVMPTTATSLVVTVSSLTATDAVGVTGYKITESATAPTAGAAGWSSTAPTTFTFSAAGSRTAYAWAKDAAGNVSAGSSRTVTITLADVTAPVVSAFSMPATATSLTVSVTSLTATDSAGVTGYMISESATAPSAGAAAWSATAPTSFTFSVTGARTAYAWAKDSAGNVSAGRSVTVTITLPATTENYSISDALQALRIASGKVKPTKEQIDRLDVAPVVNGKSVPNGTVNSGDVTVIMSKLVGKSSL